VHVHVARDNKPRAILVYVSGRIERKVLSADVVPELN
jgi:hypothetical protein